MVRGFINGNLVIGLFTSLVSVGIFWILHLPYFYFLGPISGFLSIIPYLGVVLAMIPPLAAGFGTLHGPQFITIIVTVFALHVFAINVLYPKLIGKRLQLNPLAVTIAVMGRHGPHSGSADHGGHEDRIRQRRFPAGLRSVVRGIENRDKLAATLRNSEKSSGFGNDLGKFELGFCQGLGKQVLYIGLSHVFCQG
jgi:hypothetical protein